MNMKVEGPQPWNVVVAVYTDKTVRSMLCRKMKSCYELTPVTQIAVTALAGTLSCLTLLFTKLALLLLYYRLFAAHRWTRNATYLGMAAICSLYTASVVAHFFLCISRPGENWVSASYNSRCSGMEKTNIFVGGFNVLSDVYIFLLPLPVLWNLQMPYRRKIGILAIFCTGLMYDLPRLAFYTFDYARRSFLIKNAEELSPVRLVFTIAFFWSCIPKNSRGRPH